MPGRPDLAAISTLAATSVARTVYRVIPGTRHATVLSTEGNRYYAGRYHTAGETGILYTSLSEDVATREMGRHAGERDLRTPLAVGRIKIRLPRVLDLTEEANLRSLGLTPADLISPDYTITQAISLHARRAGFQGLLVPSATGQGTNLLVFENNLGEGSLMEIEEVREKRLP